ncbi:MAG TPA: PqiC family protein, partial [Gemmatimonadales bacterium]|nr:PqiC family protein [Gemmatimonadales bacterium]
PGSIVGVGPVTLPGYLRHSQILTRYDEHKMSLAESSRWAEPLEPMVARVLRDDLAAALGAERGLEYPWSRNLAPSPVVEVDFESFERDSAGTARLDARWRVRNGTIMRAGRTRLTEPSASASNEDAVAALSRVLGRLAQEIATAARELARAE